MTQERLQIIAEVLKTTVEYLTDRDDIESSGEDDIIIQRVEQLCKEKGISLTTAFIESGAGKNFKNNMKYSRPSYSKISMLAKYFDVSVLYLKGEINERNYYTYDGCGIILSEKEFKALQLFNRVDAEQQDLLLAVMQVFSEKL